MPSHLPKYAHTEKGMIIFSNCINHLEAIKNIFGEVEIYSKGFIKCFLNENNNIAFELFAKKTKENIDEKTILTSKTEDCLEMLNKSKYIVTSSRFIIFQEELTHKEIANSLFTDFIIQGAGEVKFSRKNNKPTIICSESSTDNELNIPHRDFDSKILQDAFDILN